MIAINAAWLRSLLTPAVVQGSWPSAWKLRVTRTRAAVSWADTSMAVTLNRPRCIFATDGYHFSNSWRMALVSASTGPAPSARVVVTPELPTDNNMEAWTYLFLVSSDSSITRQLFTLKRSGSVSRIFMQARRKETSLAVNPPPSIMGWLASMNACACALSRATPRVSERRMMLALPDCALTPMTGFAPTSEGSHQRYAPGFLRSLLPCMPAQVPKAPVPTMGEPCGTSSEKAAQAE
jgi:hypothetical protein